MHLSTTLPCFMAPRINIKVNKYPLKILQEASACFSSLKSISPLFLPNLCKFLNFLNLPSSSRHSSLCPIFPLLEAFSPDSLSYWVFYNPLGSSFITTSFYKNTLTTPSEIALTYSQSCNLVYLLHGSGHNQYNFHYINIRLICVSHTKMHAP